MRSDILVRYPSAALRIYAVWTERRIFDARSRWDGGGLTDPRVVHLWDGKNVTGTWLVNHLPGYLGSDWDAYALFGPAAVWSNAAPPALLGSGSSIVGNRDQLEQAIGPLLTSPMAAGR